MCDVLGYDFYVSLAPGNVITIGLINLRTPPGSFSNIIAAYDGTAIELSYGQELRNEVTKAVLFGEKQHYLSQVTKFNHFFGEDLINGTYVPVTPYKYDVCGFWISKMIDSLNLTLKNPLGGNGPYTIHELDIRAAMASQDVWKTRVMDSTISGTFNAAVRANFPDLIDDQARKALEGEIQNPRGVNDAMNQPNRANVAANRPEVLEDLEKIWSFIKNLGDTYYGKQFITPLNQLVCYYQDPNSAVGEKIFTDTPTNAGGWVDDGTPVLGLTDPELGLFRADDGRITAFALFNIAGNIPEGEDVIGQDDTGFTGDINVPSNPTV